MRLSGDRAEAPAAAAEATRAFSGPTAFPRLDLALAKGPVRGDRQSADRLPCQGALAPWAPAFRSQEAPQGPAVPAQTLLSLEPEPRHGRRRAVTRLLGRERSAPKLRFALLPHPVGNCLNPQLRSRRRAQCGQTTKSPFGRSRFLTTLACHQ